jgi:predicted enzyme related to lactoylglutathione lyase
MKVSKFVLSALCAGAFGLIAAAPPHAPAGPRVMPRHITTPLGSRAAEVLGGKVTVTDMVKSFDFYTKVVGLRPAKVAAMPRPFPPPGPDRSKWPNEYPLSFSGTFAEAFFDLLPARGVMPTRESANLTVVMFKVPDAPAVIRRAKALGYEVISEAPEVAPGEMSIGMLRDPDGYRVEIIQAASYR